MAVATCVAAQTADKARPVASPDGQHTIRVERAEAGDEASPTRFSGNLVVRIADADGKQTHQFDINASQVRMFEHPQWLDNGWAGFTYNISKNADGVVFVNHMANRVFQAEVVATIRRMGATGKVETELTSLEVTEHANQIRVFTNITRGTSSIFPLFVKNVPQIKEREPSLEFLRKIENAVAAFDAYAAKQPGPIQVEQATESFSGNEKTAAALACVGEKPAVVIAGVDAKSPEEAMQRTRTVLLNVPLTLNCMSTEEIEHTASETTDTEVAGEAEQRFTTGWSNDSTVVVYREIFDMDHEEATRQPFVEVTVDGQVRRATASKTASEDKKTTPAVTQSF